MGARSWLCAIFLLSLPAVAATQSVEKQLADEVQRLRKQAAAQPDGDLWKQVKPGVEAGLDRIEKDVAAGRLLVAVRGLGNIRFNLLAAVYSAEHAAAQNDMAEFEREWRRMDGELLPAERRQRQMAWGSSPAVVRALAEASLGTTRPLYEASREYAAATQPLFGLFYLGQAKGALDFTLFARRLKFPEARAQFPARSLAVEIDRLEQQVEKAYQPPLSIERHPQFIGLNAWVKRAVELDQGKLYHGAMVTYLEAVRSLGELTGAAPTAEDLTRLKESAAEFEKRASLPGVDHSLARLYVELAQREIERAQAGEAPSGLSARALVENSLPAYFAAVERAGSATTTAKAELTVTLVRWPFT